MRGRRDAKIELLSRLAPKSYFEEKNYIWAGYFLDRVSIG
jgi:hypothetical protein